MSLIIGVFGLLILFLVYKFLDDEFSLMLYGVFLIYITLNFNLYFDMGVTEAVWTPFVVVSGLLTALTFAKMIYFVSKTKGNLAAMYESK